MRVFVLSLLLLSAGCADSAALGVLGLGECQFGRRGGLCTNGPCSLVVPVDSVTDVLSVELTFEAPPPGLAAETAGGLLCRVGPADLDFDGPVELRIDYSGRELPEGLELEDLSGFEVLPSGAAAPVLGARADPDFSRLILPIDGAALAGATFVPVDVDLVDVLGRVPFDVSDVPSYIRLLSSFTFEAVFFDGQRFYAGNGARLFIWSGGVPEDPHAAPDVVLGRPDLVTIDATPSAADFSGVVRAIWSDGQRLVVAEGNRVLVWRQIPTESHQPADLVLGQEDFDAVAANAGGAASAATLSRPSALASDGQRLLVADTANHRALVWNTFPRLVGQPADLVVGQETFEDTALRAGAIPMYQPRGVFYDGRRTLFTSIFGCACALGVEGPPSVVNPAFEFTVGQDASTRVTDRNFSQPSAMSAFGDGGFALRDGVGNRVSVWRTFPPASDRRPDIVIGKPDFTVGGTDLTFVSASSLAWLDNAGLAARDGVVAVPDRHRLLVWRQPPTHDFQPADLVIGQPGSTTADRGIDFRNLGRDTHAYPTAVAVAEDRVAIADEANNRVVLRWRGPQGAPRTVVLGQADGQGFLPNRGGAPGPDTLSGPRAIYTDGTRLVVADTHNHRVLAWRRWPMADGAPADLVLGQADFTRHEPNRGAADTDDDGWPDASARALFYPSGVTVWQDRLFVSDTFNHRVVVFESLSGLRSGDAAAQVIGQGDFQGVDPNRGRGWFERAGDGLAQPMGLAADARGRLFVADRENNRVVAFDRPWSQPAALALGQRSVTADDTPNFSGPGSPSVGFPVAESAYEVTASNLRRPEGVAVSEDRVVVADTYNHRLLVFDGPYTDGMAASRVLGQDDFERRARNAGGVTARSMSGPSAVALSGARLWVADRDNHRVLSLARAALEPAGPREASEILGQLDPLTNAINQSAGSPGLLSRPSGVATDGTYVWVADRDQHRVLAYDAEGAPRLVLGQSALERSSENAGRSPAADTLSGPSDVYADPDVIVVADRGNHRVLMWRGGVSALGRPADVVVGQADFQGQQPNRGRGLDAVGPDGLRSPEGVFYDGARLYVADTGNSRVLVFDEPLPSAGAVAQQVYCQPSLSDNLPNQGRDTPGADTCSNPKDVSVAEGRVWIADSINNRVLGVRFGRRAADVVVGQRDATSRRARPAAPDTLRSPTSVAYDGQNLLVTDTGNNRVLVFETPPTETGAAASQVIGQRSLIDGESSPAEGILSRPTRVTVTARPFNSARVYVADSGKSRVAVFDGLARIDAN